jgi:hypothetical protein
LIRLRILAAAVAAYVAPKVAIGLGAIALIVVLSPAHRIATAIDRATEGARRLASAVQPSTAQPSTTATKDQPTMARTKQPTAKAIEAARMAELWRQYVTLSRRNSTFAGWVMLKSSCTEAEARKYVRAFLNANGGQWPIDAPPETNAYPPATN